MLGRRSLLVLALLGGCVCEPDHLVDDAYAPAKPYGAAIDACITKHDCEPLCLSVFVLGPDQSLVSCAVDRVDAQGTAHVEMRSDDYGVCAAEDDSGDYGDDGDWGDDGGDTGDDGSCNDSSCDPGDDGSSDDGSTDDGGDTGDDGGDTGDDGGDSGDGGDTGDDGEWIYHPGSTPVKPPGIRAFHVSRARR
jgi:hypothetical protein